MSPSTSDHGHPRSSFSQMIVNFTPHLMPMSRGILETIYVKLSEGKTAADLKNKLIETYADEQFVQVLEGFVVMFMSLW
jgi:N-acetyl-gamma-glutamyl-phosphate reductase